ncbi:hypothetical protein OHA70_32065 [Kribbella sp. NBC_00382]|uniref:effector-associated constant component EACC1 n=1 Tax=Kribbella sp. NBC_00382 TaxID=2975967 RepID=UPI002E1FB722
MDVTVRVAEGDAEDELRSLRDWLATDDEFRGRLGLAGNGPAPGEMGAVVDLLTVAVGGGGVATVLAASISAWLRTRRSDVTIEITESVNLRSVKVTANRIKDPEGMIREVLDAKER